MSTVPPFDASRASSAQESPTPPSRILSPEEKKARAGYVAVPACPYDGCPQSACHAHPECHCPEPPPVIDKARLSRLMEAMVRITLQAAFDTFVPDQEPAEGQECICRAKGNTEKPACTICPFQE